MNNTLPRNQVSVIQQMQAAATNFEHQNILNNFSANNISGRQHIYVLQEGKDQSHDLSAVTDNASDSKMSPMKNRKYATQLHSNIEA